MEAKIEAPIKTVVVPLVPGFEELEAVTIIDVLRRGEVNVVVAGPTTAAVVGSHRIALCPDAALEAIAWGEIDGLVLPGGPGTELLQQTLRCAKPCGN
ncbi:MAG: hypothetical protein HC918_02670 [Oscillatoriales cyanobacterium SM2_1_8]|nr:hypothetical protein [Oscillatoriales cyanobacterium SM2_1_8]